MQPDVIQPMLKEFIYRNLRAGSFYPDDSLSIYAPLFSNVIKMDNDHLLLCVGPRGTFIEFDPVGNEVWRYINPVTETGKILRSRGVDRRSSIIAQFGV